MTENTGPQFFKVASEKPQTMKFSGMESSIEIAELSEALANFQLDVMQPKKDADNPFYGSKYVPMGNIVKAIMSVAPKHGLSYVQWAVQDEKGRVGICTRINHKTGQFMIFPPVFQQPSKGTVQDSGSVQSYQRRYSLQAAFGLGAEEDDDGNGASGIDPGETPAQKAYRENQEKKKQSENKKPAYQKGDYQKNASTSSAPQNGTKSASQDKDKGKGPNLPEMATDAQIEKINAIVNVIADTQNIHPEDVYPKFQKLYEIPGKPSIPPLDKERLTKKWAGHIISVLTKHNELGQLTEIPKKEEPKKEEPKTGNSTMPKAEQEKHMNGDYK